MFGNLSNRPGDIVAVLRSGAEYYRQAAERADQSALRELLLKSSEARDLAAEQLSSTAGTRGGSLSQTTITAVAHCLHLEARTLIERTEYALLADLCESEDRSFSELGAAPVGTTLSKMSGLTEHCGDD